MPGIVYGWPKNVLHFAGIEPSILDINATVHPDLAIVDGIVGMPLTARPVPGSVRPGPWAILSPTGHNISNRPASKR